MNSYVIVSFLEKKFPITFSQTEWPLHVTIIRNFSSSHEVSVLIDTLENVCSRQNEIITNGTSREMFGLNKDFSVTELELTSEFTLFQSNITHALKVLIIPIGLQYDSYRPHVTDHKGTIIEIGEVVNVRSISLIKIIEKERKVIHTITF